MDDPLESYDRWRRIDILALAALIAGLIVAEYFVIRQPLLDKTVTPVYAPLHGR